MTTLAKHLNFHHWPMMSLINDELHLIDAGNHYIFDKQKKVFQKIVYAFESDNVYTYRFGCCGNGSLYLKSRKCMVLFDTKCTQIHQFQTCNDKWVAFNTKMSNDLHIGKGCTMVCTYNEKHIIMLAAESHSHRSNSILVYDIVNNMLRKSSITCPYSHHAVVMRDTYGDNLMVFGFVNQCFKLSECMNMQKLPHYLIQLIGKW
eukprot:460472_1